MSVHALESDDPEAALLAIVLANEADDGGAAGDPLEVGLLEFARARGCDVEAVRRAHPRVAERAFDSTWKFMRVTVECDGTRRSYLKGAPEVLLQRCQLPAHERDPWRERADAEAHEGHRVLALASGEGGKEESLTFLGLVMLWDPPRPEVAGAIATARAAGVRVVMVTGDHPGTARAVARTIGLPHDVVRTGADLDGLAPGELREIARTTNVFARVSPEHKLALVDALKADGQIVAVTGDGVNDAPALKRSDVGVAMGQRGSDVAREVADLVLLDDDFASIVGAIEEGRSIYENIQTFIRFTFSTNVALVLVVVLGAVGSYALGLRDPAGMLMLPLTALQLLWINFLGDGPPALALAFDRNPDVMRRPPRPPRSALLDRTSTTFIAVTGLFQGLLGLAFLVVMPLLGYALVAVRTVVFLYESLAKLLSVYPARRLLRRPRTNRLLHACIAAGVAVQVTAVAVPGLRGALGLSPLDGRAVLLVVAAVAASWAAAQTVNVALRRGTRRRV
jgi:Ca2+-transporting ATPase